MDELTQQVNLALDRLKAAHNLTEGQLATHLGATRNTVYRWRKGDFSRALKTTARLTNMFSIPVPPGWAEQSKDVRILAPLLAMPKIDA